MPSVGLCRTMNGVMLSRALLSRQWALARGKPERKQHERHD